MGISFGHMIVVIILGLLLFGRGRVSDLMGDIGKGIKSFRKGLSEETEDKPKDKIPQQPPEFVDVTPPVKDTTPQKSDSERS